MAMRGVYGHYNCWRKSATNGGGRRGRFISIRSVTPYDAWVSAGNGPNSALIALMGSMRSKKRRDWLKQQARQRVDWLLVDEDESWFSRFEQPTLSAWSVDKPLQLLQPEPAENEADKALACYGAVRQDTRIPNRSICTLGPPVQSARRRGLLCKRFCTLPVKSKSRCW